MAALEAHYQTLDFETIAIDRAEAGSRALFDTSKPATLARRYEADARRGYFKALKDLRQVEAEFAAKSEVVADEPMTTKGSPPLGSLRQPPDSGGHASTPPYGEAAMSDPTVVRDGVTTRLAFDPAAGHRR